MAVFVSVALEEAEKDDAEDQCYWQQDAKCYTSYLACIAGVAWKVKPLLSHCPVVVVRATSNGAEFSEPLHGSIFTSRMSVAVK